MLRKVRASEPASPDGLQAASGPIGLRVGASYLVGYEAGDVGTDLLGELHC